MTIKKLNLERYQSKKDNQGYVSFGIKVHFKDFRYLQTNFEQKKSIENWKNNFYAAYSLNEKLVLLSIEGVSFFNSDWSGRKDYPLDRNKKLYQFLEEKNQKGNLNVLERVFKKLLIKNSRDVFRQ